MRLILARHGNTFEPGSTPYCVGATEDLPLVEKGRMQAAQFGQALKDAGAVVSAWYRGPLTRHKQFSETAITSVSVALAPIVDERLNELNYGNWAGLTDQQIKDKFGAAIHEDWVQRSTWAADMNWKPSLDQLRAEIASFLSDMSRQYKAADTVVAVTSGGRLRFFLEAIASGEFEHRCKNNDIKISTGHACIFDYVDGNWSIVCWNVEPTAIDVKLSEAALT